MIWFIELEIYNNTKKSAEWRVSSILHLDNPTQQTVTFRYSNSCVPAVQDRRLYEKVQTLERLKECQAWDSSDFAAAAISGKKEWLEEQKN